MTFGTFGKKRKGPKGFPKVSTLVGVMGTGSCQPIACTRQQLFKSLQLIACSTSPLQNQAVQAGGNGRCHCACTAPRERCTAVQWNLPELGAQTNHWLPRKATLGARGSSRSCFHRVFCMYWPHQYKQAPWHHQLQMNKDGSEEKVVHLSLE